jgi:hypothetical protein
MNGLPGRALIALVLLGCSVRAGAQTLDEVTLNPSPPLQLMPFRVDIAGEKAYEEVTFVDTAYSRMGTDLTLDFRFHLPEGAVRPSTPPYSASYLVEPLPAGNYRLQVRTLLDGGPADGAVVLFTVVPEPATITAGLAGVLLLARRRRVTAR